MAIAHDMLYFGVMQCLLCVFHVFNVSLKRCDDSNIVLGVLMEIDTKFFSRIKILLGLLF